ncbi:hypothetical protein VPNG_03628 [Cytospora leucostoma]|uniref:Major facilitator superfamily (MFS) profile domain-containing protein n=1 Tax=Cytospora leucostoma TaxID=1230097 RepID=A0A423XCT9_9PEZI|nr:hypothetical protein VPNG_03628 [Cytospora leucostoma]
MSETIRTLDNDQHANSDITTQKAPADISANDHSPLIVVPSNPAVPVQDLEGHTTTARDREAYPEGGLQAWLVAYVKVHQLSEYDEGTTGWIVSILTFVVFLLGLYIGPLFDKYGPRWLILAGTLSVSASLMLFRSYIDYAPELWHFILTSGLLCDTGCSLLFAPSFAAVGHYFQTRRGLATGIASTGGSIGGIVFPLMLESLLTRIGWGWAIRACMLYLGPLITLYLAKVCKVGWRLWEVF